MNYAELLQELELQNQDFVIREGEDFEYPYGKYPYQNETYLIIGACMEVHRVLGRGFLESVYHEALCMELTLRNIPFESKKILPVYYKEFLLNKKFEADIFAFDHIIVELKAMEGALDGFTGQVVNYLSATKQDLGLLVNFGMPTLQYKRIIDSRFAKK